MDIIGFLFCFVNCVCVSVLKWMKSFFLSVTPGRTQCGPTSGWWWTAWLNRRFGHLWWHWMKLKSSRESTRKRSECGSVIWVRWSQWLRSSPLQHLCYHLCPFLFFLFWSWTLEKVFEELQATDKKVNVNITLLHVVYEIMLYSCTL